MDQFSDKQINEFRETFRLFDRNNDGVISVAELEKAMRSIGCNPTRDEVAAMVEAIDVNKNGVVDFPEFVMMVSGQVTTEGGAKLKALAK